MTEDPDKKEAQEFWGSIWGEKKRHCRGGKWLKIFKSDLKCKEEHKEIEITQRILKRY